MKYEPLFRSNLLILARAYAKATGFKLTTISNKIAGDSRFFPDLVGRKPKGFSVGVYDRVIANFRAAWPEGVAFPEISEPQ
jgi:hypothetical protein